MKKYIYLLIALTVIGLFASLLGEGGLIKPSMKNITANEIFNQKEESYLVYFYQDTCSYCEQLKPEIEKTHSAQTPIYMVDMAQEENKSLWYDWETHHKRYDVELGLMIGDKEALYEGINKEDYSNTDIWSLEVNGDRLIATHNEAKNNKNPQTVEEIEIAGTPVLYHIYQGKFYAMAEGYSKCLEMLADFQYENLMREELSELEEEVEEEPLELQTVVKEPTPIN